MGMGIIGMKNIEIVFENYKSFILVETKKLTKFEI